MIITYNSFAELAKSSLDLSNQEYLDAGVVRKNLVELNPYDIKDGDIVFVKTDFIVNGIFQRYFLPKIKNKFILITGISDYTVSNNLAESLLSTGKINHWFACNPPLLDHKKISFLPIGFQEEERLKDKKQYIEEKIYIKNKWEDKKNKIYIPYHSPTDLARTNIIKTLQDLKFIEIEKNKLPFTEYIEKIKNYKYILSLRGNGWDTHRNYEILLVDSIPVIQEGPIQNHFLKNNIPFFNINSIHKDMFKSKEVVNKDILKISYWNNIINSFK